MKISDLHNPNKITAILHKDGNLIAADSKDQGFQEYPGSWELWQKLDDGRLLRVQRWLKKSIVCIYS